jgi:hypothetical protein
MNGASAAGDKSWKEDVLDAEGIRRSLFVQLSAAGSGRRRPRRIRSANPDALPGVVLA